MIYRMIGTVALSAIAVSLAQPSELMLKGNAFLGLIGWAPFFWALRQTSTCGKVSLLSGFFGGLTIVLQNFWLAYFQRSGLEAFGSVVVLVSLFYALLGPFIWTLLRRREPWRIFLVGVVWAVSEFLRSNGLIAFPWGLVPYPFYEWSWLTQIIDITGLGLLSFLIISWNAWLSELLELRKPLAFSSMNLIHSPLQKTSWLNTLSFFTVIIALLATYSIYRLNESRPIRGYVNLVLVQHNDDSWVNDEEKSLLTSLRLSQEGLRQGNIDLVIWSEGALRYPLALSRSFYAHFPPSLPVLSVVQNSHTYWLFGNPHTVEINGRTARLNASILVNPQGKIVDYYGKKQLIPAAEYIPLWEIPAVQDFFRSQGLYSYSRGHKTTIYQIPIGQGKQNFRFATPICFEDSFPSITREMVLAGAEILINLTNDSWSKKNSSQVQHYVVSTFRSIESRVPLARATNSGVSCVTDPNGHLLAGPLPYFQEAQLTVPIPLYKERIITFYTRYGDWLIFLFMVLLLIEFGIGARRLLND